MTVLFQGRLVIDNNLLGKCIQIAADAHYGQIYSRGIWGEPYILHPIRVMQAVGDSQLIDHTKKILVKCVAVLHDVMEDTYISEEKLIYRYFLPEEILIPLRLLTHKKETPYEKYIEDLCNNPIANVVKYADITDNLFHLPEMVDRDKAFRLRIKYGSAKDYILQHNHYNSLMWLNEEYAKSDSAS